MNERAIDAVYLVLVLLLPVGALAARRLPLGDTVRMALAWAAVFALLFVLVAVWQIGTGAGFLLESATR